MSRILCMNSMRGRNPRTYLLASLILYPRKRCDELKDVSEINLIDSDYKILALVLATHLKEAPTYHLFSSKDAQQGRQVLDMLMMENECVASRYKAKKLV